MLRAEVVTPIDRERLDAMDYQIFHAINQLAGRYDGIDDSFELISRFAPFVLIALVIGLWFWPGDRTERDQRQWTALVATVAAAVALGFNQIVIHLWQRPRPFESHQVNLLLTPSHDPSFPSDHATFAFAIAVALVLGSRRVGLVAIGIAVLIALSRVYVGEHYGSDVAVAALIGSVIAYTLFRSRPITEPVVKPALRLARRVHLA